MAFPRNTGSSWRAGDAGRHGACSHRGPGGHLGGMALTGHSHRSGNDHRHDAPALPAGLRAQVVPARRAGRPRWPSALPRQGPELATTRIPSNARAWQSYRAYSPAGGETGSAATGNPGASCDEHRNRVIFVAPASRFHSAHTQATRDPSRRSQHRRSQRGRRTRHIQIRRVTSCEMRCNHPVAAKKPGRVRCWVSVAGVVRRGLWRVRRGQRAGSRPATGSLRC